MSEDQKIYKVVSIEKATGVVKTEAENLTREDAQTLAVKLSYQTNKFLYKVTK